MTVSAKHAERVWKNPNYLRFWSGVTISGIGSQITMVALPLTALVTLKADAGDLGLLTAVQYLPTLLITPVAGILADRFPRRQLNIWCDLARGLLLLVIPLTAAVHVLSFPVLLASGFVLGCLKSIGDIAHHAMLPQLVTDKQLTAGNAGISASYSVTDVTGPAIGGVLVQAVGAPFAILADSVSFLASGTLLALSRPRPDAVAPAARGRWLSLVKAGFSYLLADRRLLILAICSGVANIAIQAYMTAYVIFAVHDVGLSPGALGLVYGAGALGGLAGASLATPISRRTSPGAAMLIGMGAAAAGILTVALSVTPSGQAARITVVIIGMMAFDCGLGVYNVHAITARQTLARPELLGRVTASYRLISHGAVPLGALLGGFFAGSYGATTAIVVAGTFYLLWTLALPFTPFRSLLKPLADS
ncbi:MFS transporter [Streptosporangium sp. NPDC020072]|uniref:MFS transporter n=1 Tax=Streptosporangium sp. NPDC020072 TaxID=3154788 RepID=UPI0034327E3F